MNLLEACEKTRERLYWPKRSVTQVIIALLVSLQAGATAFAAGINAKPVLPLGVSEFAPFEYADTSGKIIGADTEIVEQVLARMGYVPRIQLLPWARVQREAERGKLAGLYSLTKTPEREALYYFTDPINTVKDVFFKRKANPLDWRTLDDLFPLRVASVAAYGYAGEFTDALAKKKFASSFELFDTDANLRGLRAVSNGVADIFICEISVCSSLIKAHAPALDDLDFSPTTVGPVRNFYIAFSRKWPDAEKLRDAFNTELAKFVQEGERRRIFKKYRIESSLK